MAEEVKEEVAEEIDPLESILADIAAEQEAEVQPELQDEAGAGDETPDQKEAAEAAAEAEANPPVGQKLPWFEKRLSRWNTAQTGRDAKIKDLDAKNKDLESKLSARVEAGAIPPEVQADYDRLKSIVGNLDKTAAGKTWLQGILRDMASGKEPDWEGTEKQLSEWRKALPGMNPAVVAQMQRLEQQVAAMGDARVQDTVDAHITRENTEIAKLLQKAVGDDREEFEFLYSTVQDLALSAGNKLAKMERLEDLPSRVAITKRLLASRDRSIQAALKARLPKTQEVARAAVRAGAGTAAGAGKGAAQSMPLVGSRAWDKWAAGESYTPEDEKN